MTFPPTLWRPYLFSIQTKEEEREKKAKQDSRLRSQILSRLQRTAPVQNEPSEAESKRFARALSMALQFNTANATIPSVPHPCIWCESQTVPVLFYIHAFKGRPAAPVCINCSKTEDGLRDALTALSLLARCWACGQPPGGSLKICVDSRVYYACGAPCALVIHKWAEEQARRQDGKSLIHSCFRCDQKNAGYSCNRCQIAKYCDSVPMSASWCWTTSPRLSTKLRTQGWR